MPTLPTITINDAATWSRLMAAFDADPVKYKTWLKERLIDEVRRAESVAAYRQTQVDLDTQIPTT